MLYKIVDKVANVPNQVILIPADSRTKSKHGHKFCIMTNTTNTHTNILPMNHIPVELYAKSISTLHPSSIGHISIYTPMVALLIIYSNSDLDSDVESWWKISICVDKNW